jgi:RNA polymerase sigma-70 factor, ECF subfamily
METDRSTEFLSLLTQHDRALSVYVYSLVTSNADADDILQQTKMVLWKSFAQFELGTNFLAWARKTAFHQILAYRRQKKKEHLPLEDDVLEAISHEVEKLSSHSDHRGEALQVCVQKLPHEHRQLVRLRYYEDMEVEQIATQIQSTDGAVYRALSRIRLSLLDCVEKQIKAEGAHS